MQNEVVINIIRLVFEVQKFSIKYLLIAICSFSSIFAEPKELALVTEKDAFTKTDRAN